MASASRGRSLDSRERHQVVDQPLHPVRLLVHDAEEARAIGGVGEVQRLDDADERGQRRAQLVAGVGDEIGAHPLGGVLDAAVLQPHEAAGGAGGLHRQFPAPLAGAEP